MQPDNLLRTSLLYFSVVRQRKYSPTLPKGVPCKAEASDPASAGASRGAV